MFARTDDVISIRWRRKKTFSVANSGMFVVRIRYLEWNIIQKMHTASRIEYQLFEHNTLVQSFSLIPLCLKEGPKVSNFRKFISASRYRVFYWSVSLCKFVTNFPLPVVRSKPVNWFLYNTAFYSSGFLFWNVNVCGSSPRVSLLLRVGSREKKNDLIIFFPSTTFL